MERFATHMLVALLALAFAGRSAISSAHTLPKERTMMLQVKPESVEAMVVFQEPPGKRLSLLKAQHDIDGDGEFSETEAVSAGSSWIPYCLQGLEFRLPEGARRSEPEIKFQNEHHGSLTAAVYLEWQLPEPIERTLTVGVARTDDAAPFATLVRFQATAPLAFKTVPDRHPDAELGIRVGPYNLAPGKTLDVTVERTGWTFDDLPTRRP